MAPWTAGSDAGSADHADAPHGAGEQTIVGVIRDLDRLAGVWEAWDLLAARSGNPMQQHAWITACASAFAMNREMRFFLAGTAEGITAIAPLVGGRSGGGRLELLAADEIYEPMDFLYNDPAGLQAVTDALAEAQRPLLLKRIPADSPVIAALRRSYRGRGVVICRPVAGYPRIRLDPSWVRPEEKLNPGRRSDLRRAQRIAEGMGAMSSEVLLPAPAALEPLLDEAFRVEGASWKGRNGTALASDAARGLFYQRYAVAACEKGILRVCFLRIGGKAAAMQLAVECGGRFWLLKIGYDPEFQRCSPGTLLIRESVRYAAGRGLSGYEFLGIVEPWTEMWTQEVHSCVSLRAYPSHWSGCAALATDLARYLWRRRRGRTPDTR